MKHFLCIFSLLFFFPLFKALPETPGDPSLRSFHDLFPGLSESQKSGVSSPEGLIRSGKADEALMFSPSPDSGIDLLSALMKIEPSYVAESLLLIPYEGRPADKLDIYRALGKIRDLKGRLYHSHTRDADIPLFEDAARIEDERSGRALPDPPPAAELPPSESVHIRLKDANFGNSYYRGDMSAKPYGVAYSLTNTKSLTYLVFPVMKAGKFSAALYMEPLAEGILVYSAAGAAASDFIASMVDIPSAISKRLAVFIGWISDGIKTRTDN